MIHQVTTIARNAYPEYGTQGMTSPWMASDTSGSTSRSKHGSWGTYGQETTPITPGFPSYNHSTPPPGSQAHGWATAPEAVPRNDGMAWGSAYPTASQQPFSPMSGMTTPTSAYDRKSNGPIPGGHGSGGAASMPAAEMYPPLPNMENAGGASSSLSPPQGPTAQSTSYGSWGQQQSYPPLSKPGDGYGGGGGWYSQGDGGHAAPQPAMAQGLPVTDGYYAQR